MIGNSNHPSGGNRKKRGPVPSQHRQPKPAQKLTELGIQKILKRRVSILVKVLLAVTVFLMGRLFWLQVVDRADLESKNLNQIESNRKLQSPRGAIYDRDGHPLAVSAITKSLYADPKMINQDPEEIAHLLAPYTRIKEDKIVEALQEDTGFVWLDRMMDNDKSTAVKEVIKENKIVGLDFVEESRRFYPNGKLLSQVLGFVGTDDKGLDGLEMVLDSDIRGDVTKEIVATDVQGHPIFNSVMSKFIPDKEKSVSLTIDSTIQFIAERALDKAVQENHPTGASIIIMDPKTGEILAMANRPSYDPNNYGKATEEDFKNRAVTNLYEPGSTFKPIIASAALASGKWTTTQVFHDTGAVVASGHAIQNWNDEGYGDVRLLEILKYSINTGMAHIGLTTGPDILTQYVKAFGFGSPTGIELPGEGDGILFDPANMADIDTATMSIGQGIAVTPLQMVRAFGALANNGKMMKPHIIKSINNPDGSVYKETEITEVGQPIPPEVDKEIVNILEKEVSEGGGNKAMVDGYHFAGKTGTAEKLDTENGGYLKGRYIGSFIGFGPVDDAKFVALIVIDDPSGTYYGGQIAAPVFKDIMSQLVRYYQISPSVTTAYTGQKTERPAIPAVTHDSSGQVVIPNFAGWTMGEVRNWLNDAKLVFKPDGTGYAVSQDDAIGSTVPEGTAITVHFAR